MTYNFNGIGTSPDAVKSTELFVGGLPQNGLNNPVPETYWDAYRCTGLSAAVTRGTSNVFVTVRIGGVLRSVSGRYTTADSTGSTTAAGRLPNNNITPLSVTFTHGGAGNNVADNGSGILVDSGTSTARGVIDYTTGVYSYTASGAKGATTVAYTHTDYVDIPSDTAISTETSTNGAGTKAHVGATAYPVVPNTFTAVDDSSGPSTCTLFDDGKGNVIQTLSANAVVGTINYKTGAISLAGLDTNIDTKLTYTYNRNMFGRTVAAGGGRINDLFVPEGAQDYFGHVTDAPADDAVYSGRMRHVKMAVFAEALTADRNTKVAITANYTGDDTFLLATITRQTNPMEQAAITGVHY